MMSLNTRVTSVLLACSMIISSNSFSNASSATEKAVEKFSQKIMTYVSNNPKVVSTVIVLLIAAKIRLMTKARPKVEYSMDDFNKDVEELFSSFNIFDKKVRAKIMNFIDKYLVGVEVKIEDTSTRTDNEDGSVFTIKGKKLTQKPFGAMGLFDAYVLAQMKKITDYIPAMALMYVLVNDPVEMFGKAVTKAKD